MRWGAACSQTPGCPVHPALLWLEASKARWRGAGRGTLHPELYKGGRGASAGHPPLTHFLMSLERRFLLKGGVFFLLVISRSRSATAL